MTNIDPDELYEEEPEQPSYIIFISRKKINGQNIIVDWKEYHPVEEHGRFIKLRIDEEQKGLIKNWGRDAIDLNALKIDFSDPDQVMFLSEEQNSDTKDVRVYGLALSKYLIINNPVQEVIDE